MHNSTHFIFSRRNSHRDLSAPENAIKKHTHQSIVKGRSKTIGNQYELYEKSLNGQFRTYLALMADSEKQNGICE